jgi:hypothetical protein
VRSGVGDKKGYFSCEGLEGGTSGGRREKGEEGERRGEGRGEAREKITDLQQFLNIYNFFFGVDEIVKRFLDGIQVFKQKY